MSSSTKSPPPIDATALSCSPATKAYLDASNVLVVEFEAALMESDIGPEFFQILGDGDRRIFPSKIEPIPQGWPASRILLEFTSALPFRGGDLRILIADCREPIFPVPRRILSEGSEFAAVDARLGATCSSERTEFAVFAPTATSVAAVLYDRHKGPEGREEIELTIQPGGIWRGSAGGDLHGQYYMYRLEGPDLDPTREAIDPYARCVSNRGGRGIVVDLMRTNPPGFNPRSRPPQPNENGIVVYEAHVRDFTIHPDSGIEKRGKYLGLAERGTHLAGHPDISTGLDHLIELGVSHVQLLPVQDFDNDEESDNYRWGYMPANFNSPEGWYATNPYDVSRIIELKTLIQALHEAGIRVIIDVVYNHTDISSSFDAMCPGYYYRMHSDGTYSNGAGCGNEFRSEAPMARKFIIDSCRYWVEEYGVDGFRFDLMGLIDLETMLELRREILEIDRTLLLWGEPWTAAPNLNPAPTDHHTLRGSGIASFNDRIRDVVKGSTRGSGGGFVQHGGGADELMKQIAGAIDAQAEAPTEPLHYVSAHDDNVLWDKLAISAPHASEDERARMQMMCAAIVLTAQGKPFLHGGDEMLRTKHGVENSYNSPDSINQVDYALKLHHRDVFEYHRGLIAIRRAHPAFHLTRRAEIYRRLSFDLRRPTGKSVAFTLDGHGIRGESWNRIRVIHNTDAAGFEFPLPPGEWKIVASDGRAGLETLGLAMGRVFVDGRRSTILWL